MHLTESDGFTKSPKRLFLPFLTYLLVYPLFFFLDFKPIVSYAIICLSVSIIFIFLCWYIFKIKISLKQVYILLFFSIALRIIFLFVQPIGSEDYYRYLWDGKVLANGINPYQYAPADEALNNLHSNILPEKVSFPDVKTIYPPLSLVLFYLSYLLGGESFIGIKIILLLFELAAISGLLLLIKQLKLPHKYILFYALAPLPIFQFFVDAHLDGFGIALLIFSIFFHLKKKKILSLIFISLSICIKPLGLILLPIFFFQEKNTREKIKVIIVPLITCTLIYIPFLSVSTFDALLNFTVNWTFNGFVFEIINHFLNNNQSSRLICGIIFLILYLIVILYQQKLLNKIYLSIFLLLIFSPIVHPWYVAWLTVLLPFIPRWSGILYTSLVSLTVFTIMNYQLYGEWKNYPLVLFFEYIPILILFFYEFKNKSLIEMEAKA